MPKPTCPSGEQLRAYLADTLPEASRRTLEAHLGMCAECRAALGAGVDASGAFAEPRELPGVTATDAPRLRQLGEYALLKKLGQGGMGAVYEALHTRLDRLVALKVLPQAIVADDEAIARFRREMRVVGRLDHPNLVRAHDAREIEGTHFLVMEYVDGFDLAELVRRLGPLNAADACELIRQAAQGLQYAHEHGLVHRDIKPSNVMLTMSGQVKILDLGLARWQASGEEMTATGQVMGTPDYMAPEQISDSRNVDIRADLYGLGCTLYKLLAAQPPFGAPPYTSAFEKMAAHLRDPVPPLSRFRRDLPEGLEAVVTRMLAKQPERRYATPQEVAEALGRFAAACDLPGLMAKAMGRQETAQDAAGELRSTAKSAGLSTSAGGALGTASSGRRRWTPWRVAAVVLIVVVCVMVLGRAHRRAQKRAQDNAATAVVSQADGQTRQQPVAEAAALSGWIVMSWTSEPSAKPSLWLFSPDGKRRVRVTHDAGSMDFQPCFSPDGRRLAFVRMAGLRRSSALWVCDVDGKRPRPLVTPQGASERFASPVWISSSQIVCARDPAMDRSPDMEVWQVDAEGNGARRLFRLADALGEGAGLVTSASPDGKRLAIVAQTPGQWPTADVYVTDLDGKHVQTIWMDRPDNRKDARALWSPDGRTIAWQHNFVADDQKAVYFGIGLARAGTDRPWDARLQPQRETFLAPLAWSPGGGELLCARFEREDSPRSPPSLVLVDEQFRVSRVLFELPDSFLQPVPREIGRLADWAIVPADVRVGE